MNCELKAFIIDANQPQAKDCEIVIPYDSTISSAAVAINTARYENISKLYVKCEDGVKDTPPNIIKLVASDDSNKIKTFFLDPRTNQNSTYYEYNLESKK